MRSDFVITVKPKPYWCSSDKAFRTLPIFSSAGIYGSVMDPVPIMHFFALALQGTFKQFDGVFFYFYVFKIMIHVVAGAARVAINTAVRTATVKIQAIFCG